MKKLFVASILSFLFSFGLFAQTNVIKLHNRTKCDLLYSVYEVSPGTCGTFQVHNIVIPASTSNHIIASAPGNEFNRAVMSFVVNNCVGMNLANPNPSSGCMNCPINYFLSSYSFTPSCNNPCNGVPLYLEWINYCNGGSEIYVTH